MNFKKIFAIFLLLFSLSSIAQNEKTDEKKEQIKALKVAFLTTELKLTSNEAEKFWPIYNSFEDKQFEFRHGKMKSLMNKLDDESLEKMTEKEANSLLSQMENSEENLHQLRKDFIQNLKKIIPASKIIKLKKSEEKFNRKLLQQYRDKGPKKD